MAIICTELKSIDAAIQEAIDRVQEFGTATRVETKGHPSRTYLVSPKDYSVKLSGFRAVQPKRLASQKDGVEIYRLPLPRKGTVAGNGQQQLFVGTGHQTEINWDEHGVDWKRAGNTETWSARRINQLESADGAGSAVWRDLAKRFGQEIEDEYDPKTVYLHEHAKTMSVVLARLARDPKRRLGRKHRIIPVVKATEIDTESFAWLMRQSGRTPEEKAHRGVLCSVRTTDYDTLENRVVRDFAQRTISEVRRTERPPKDLREWSRKCSIVNRNLANIGVGVITGHVQPNQVLRMNPDYLRVWEARKELLNQMELTELLWCWQGETWNEFVLCMFKASMAKYLDTYRFRNPESEWQAVIHSPIRMRRGQREGRWIETDQQTAGIWINQNRQRVLKLLGGGLRSLDSPAVPACRALMYEISCEAKPIATMDVYAIPPIDVSNGLTRETEASTVQQEGHGRIMLVSGAYQITENVLPREPLTNAMRTIHASLDRMEQNDEYK